MQEPITQSEAHALERVALANFGPCSGKAEDHSIHPADSTCPVCHFIWSHAVGQVHYRRNVARLLREEGIEPPPTSSALPW